jgi:hypothetical protein
MVDKITTVPRSKLGSRAGQLDDEDVVRLNRAMLVFGDYRRQWLRGGQAKQEKTIPCWFDEIGPIDAVRGVSCRDGANGKGGADAGSAPPVVLRLGPRCGDQAFGWGTMRR